MNRLISVDASVITNKGMVRENNEDNFYLNGSFMRPHERDKEISLTIEECTEDFIFSVCDGMGGEQYGEKASLAAVTELKRYHDNLKESNNVHNLLGVLVTYIERTNELLYDMSLQYGCRMGTTFAGLVISGNEAAALNIGDSRVYLCREGHFTQLTLDHTEAESLVRMGVLTKEKAQKHKSKHRLTRHLGISPEEGKMDAFVTDIFYIKTNDVFLLCSDGLTDMIDESMIRDIIISNNNSTGICSCLVREALKAGGADNITSMVIRVEDAYTNSL